MRGSIEAHQLAGGKFFSQNTPDSSMDSRNIHLKGARWKNISRDVHGEVVLRQYSEHKAEQYKELQEEPILTLTLLLLSIQKNCRDQDCKVSVKRTHNWQPSLEAKILRRSVLRYNERDAPAPKIQMFSFFNEDGPPAFGFSEH